MWKSPAWTEQLWSIYPLPVMEVGVICRLRAFTLRQDAAESRGADQLASFGMPKLWQILPTAVQLNQDWKGICDFLKAKFEGVRKILKDTCYKPRGIRGMSVCLELISHWGAVPWPLGTKGRWARLAPGSHTPLMHRDRQGWHPSRAMDMLGQAGRLSPDFPCAVSNIYLRYYKISYWDH